MENFISNIDIITIYIGIVITATVGGLFFKSRQFDDAIVFLGFLLLSLVGVHNLYFGPSATFNAEMELIEKNDALLSFNTTYIIVLIGYILVAAGYIVKLVKNWGVKT